MSRMTTVNIVPNELRVTTFADLEIGDAYVTPEEPHIPCIKVTHIEANASNTGKCLYYVEGDWDTALEVFSKQVIPIKMNITFEGDIEIR